MMQTIPVNWKKCATCSRWCGKQEPDFFCKNIKFDSNENARCAGGGFNNCKMTGMQTCPKWTPRFN